MLPEQVVQAAEDLKARVFFPVHWAKFSLSLHAWDEPIERVTAEAKRQGSSIVHPMIGEPLYLDEIRPSETWWQHLK
jgi:L-ascorbate metabolism protein UlaG (beta-lactamase superfamily)